MTLMEGMMSEILILGFKKTTDILKQYKINVTEREKVNIINKINRNFESEVTALKFCDKAPVLNNKGIYILSQEQKTITKKVARELELQNKPNDPHALLTKEPIWTADPVVFDYNFTDFSVIKYFRDEGVNAGANPQLFAAGWL